VHGRASHAGLAPQDGVNAVHELAQQITRLQKWNDSRRGISVNADVIEGGTRVNVIAERARAVIDLRALRLAGTCAASRNACTRCGPSLAEHAWKFAAASIGSHGTQSQRRAFRPREIIGGANGSVDRRVCSRRGLRRKSHRGPRHPYARRLGSCGRWRAHPRANM